MKRSEAKVKESINPPHIPVLLKETIDSFKSIKDEDGYFIDCTLGYAGHSEAILRAYPNLKLIGIDRDLEALNFSKERLKPFSKRIELIHGEFSKTVPNLLKSKKIVGLLADFGVSSLQLDKRERGFSFDSEILDMRMDTTQSFNAKDVVNSYSSLELERIFYQYGEIKNAKTLASKIVQARAKKPITSAKELSKIIEQVAYKKRRLHPATLAFQAIRIEVNKELDVIKGLLDALEQNPPSGAIVSLIAFHSLEDREVKKRFNKWARGCICPIEAIRCSCGGNNNLGRVLSKKPITAKAQELKLNPRSKSAKLRVFQFKRV